MTDSESELLNAAAMSIGRDRAEVLLGKIKDEFPMEMRLCEQNYVILKPDQPYIFRYDSSCPSCREVAKSLGIVWQEN